LRNCAVCSRRRRDGLILLASSRRRMTGLVWLACSPEEGAVCSSPSQPASDQMMRLTSGVTKDMVVGNQPMYGPQCSNFSS
jgi:hypothetical protein